MQLNKEAVSINETVMRDFSQFLVEGDIIVPDIRPDMAKILQIDATAMADNVMTGNGVADISGKVNLKILYVPEESEQPVASISSVMEFNSQIENSAITPDSKCIVEVDVGRVDFNMLNSRKMSVRVVVEVQSRCMHENMLELVKDIEDTQPVEMRKDNISLYNIVSSGHTKFMLKETLDFPAGKPSAVSVLKMDAKITDKDTRMVTGKIVIKGTVTLCTLYISTENMIEFMEHEVPFTEVIDVDGARENAVCDMDMWICQCEFDPRVDVDGDMRLIDIELTFGVNVTVTQDSVMEVVSDCFCPGRNMVCERKDFQFDEIAGQGMCQHALREIISLSEDMPEIVTVYNIITKPYISDTKAQKGKAVVTGTIDCYVLYMSSSAIMPLNSYKKQMEFTCNIDIDGLEENMDCDVKVEVAHAGYNLTMSGEVEVRASLILSAKAVRSKTVHMLTDARIDDEAQEQMRHGIIIYFASGSDELWDIAKKYQITVEELKELNKLEEESRPKKGCQLLIPNSRRKKQAAK